MCLEMGNERKRDTLRPGPDAWHGRRSGEGEKKSAAVGEMLRGVHRAAGGGRKAVRSSAQVMVNYLGDCAGVGLRNSFIQLAAGVKKRPGRRQRSNRRV